MKRHWFEVFCSKVSDLINYRKIKKQHNEDMLAYLKELHSTADLLRKTVSDTTSYRQAVDEMLSNLRRKCDSILETPTRVLLLSPPLDHKICSHYHETSIFDAPVAVSSIRYYNGLQDYVCDLCHTVFSDCPAGHTPRIVEAIIPKNCHEPEFVLCRNTACCMKCGQKCQGHFNFPKVCPHKANSHHTWSSRYSPPGWEACELCGSRRQCSTNPLAS